MAGGSLYDILIDRKKLKPWKWRIQAALEVALAIAYLHGEKRVQP